MLRYFTINGNIWQKIEMLQSKPKQKPKRLFLILLLDISQFASFLQRT
jgi:hypothetical protein